MKFDASSRSHASHGAEKSSPPVGFDRGEKLRVLSLFAGIGGFDLGLGRTGGFETVAFCEIDPFCQRVLAKHWPGVPCYDDVRTLTADRLAADGIVPDVIVGGFPCQDISLAGAGAGIEGERSGLWSDYARIVGELGPAFVIVENVSALLGRGLDRVLRDLAALGYDAEWHCIPAAAVGAPHRRDRFWLVAHPNGERGRAGDNKGGAVGNNGAEARDGGSNVADARCQHGDWRQDVRPRNSEPNGKGFEDWEEAASPPERGRENVADAAGERCGKTRGGQGWGWFAGRCRAVEHEWDAEPNVGRVAHGVPARVDRLKALGNAVVPQIPELIGNAILASLADQRDAA